MAARIVVPYNKEMLTVSNAAKALTLSVYDIGELRGAIEALITVGTASIRFWLDGSTPVATSSGHLVAAGSSITLTDGDIKKFKAIRETSTDAVLAITYYRAA